MQIYATIIIGGRMKRIIIISLSLVVIVFAAIFVFRKEINVQMRNTFLSTAILIGSSFETDLILEKYTTHEEIEYITLRELDYSVSGEVIDLDNSYVAFSNDNNDTLMYITLIGRSKYKNMSYINVYKKDLSTKTITTNRKTIDENTKEINAVKYKEA